MSSALTPTPSIIGAAAAPWAGAPASVPSVAEALKRCPAAEAGAAVSTVRMSPVVPSEEAARRRRTGRRGASGAPTGSAVRSGTAFESREAF